MCSHIATPRRSQPTEIDFNKKPSIRHEMTQFDEDGSYLRFLEGWIDEHQAQLPPLTKFILPVSLC
jgi:cob(I)alamin adenosyltransferase